METTRSTLSDNVLNSLQNDILGGCYEIGRQLPAESELAKQFGVSRTIIREVISALKATGQVESRHGSGIYVVTRYPAAHKGPLFDADYVNLSDILEVMELRMAVEIEAAGLAAIRRTPAQLMKLLEVLRGMEKAIKSGNASDINDYDFHRAIATATSNDRYVEFFNFFRGKVIPRSRLYRQVIGPDQNNSYLQQILQEHYIIYHAIAANDDVEARSAMRSHLVAGKNYYKRLFMQWTGGA